MDARGLWIGSIVGVGKQLARGEMGLGNVWGINTIAIDQRTRLCHVLWNGSFED